MALDEGAESPRLRRPRSPATRTVPHLTLPEFEHLAGQTRLGHRARDMARMALVDGKSMHDVAVAFATIPQRVQLAVGSIHRVQAAWSWQEARARATVAPDALLAPLCDYVSGLSAMRPGQVDHAVIAELQLLLGEARQRIGRG